MSIDKQAVEHIARLARLKVPDTEIKATAAQLGSILTLADQMQAVNTDNIQPLSHPQDPTLRLREDVVTETDRRDAFMALTEHNENGLYLVPKVID